MNSIQQQQRDTTSITPLQQMLASCTGAVITALMMTPFDVVKTRLQAQNQPQVIEGVCGPVLQCAGAMEGAPLLRSTGAEAVCSACGHSRMRLHGTVDAFMKIAAVEGPSSLWRGMVPALATSVPATVIYFTAYDRLRSLSGPQSSNYAPAIAGALSRTLAATVVSPIELVRTKMQAGTWKNYHDLFLVVRAAVNAQGPLVLWRGLGPTLFRDVPFSAMYWVGYEHFRRAFGARYFGRKFKEGAPPLQIAFAAGALSGAIAATLTLPFDVVKTRQQSLLGRYVQACPQGADVAKAVPKESALIIIREVLRNYGVAGLFAGLTPRIVKVAPACAIMISTYEAFKQFFRRQNAGKSASNTTTTTTTASATTVNEGAATAAVNE